MNPISKNADLVMICIKIIVFIRRRSSIIRIIIMLLLLFLWLTLAIVSWPPGDKVALFIANALLCHLCQSVDANFAIAAIENVACIERIKSSSVTHISILPICVRCSVIIYFTVYRRSRIYNSHPLSATRLSVQYDADSQ